eukprot:jgi/Mesvir1/24843/Mv22080-RA.1
MGKKQDLLSLQGQSGVCGSMELAIRQQVRAERQQELETLSLELTEKQEKIEALEGELTALKQKATKDELARTALELQLLKATTQGTAKEQENTVEKWQETYRCAWLASKSQPPPPLLLVARTGRLDVVKHFVQFGVDLDVSDDNGYSPLHRAAENGHAEVAMCLVKAGAKLNNATGKGGQTALHIGHPACTGLRVRCTDTVI